MHFELKSISVDKVSPKRSRRWSVTGSSMNLFLRKAFALTFWPSCPITSRR